MSQLESAPRSQVVPYPLDPEPVELAESQDESPPPEDPEDDEPRASVGPAIAENDPVDLQPVSADVDPPAEEDPPADVNLQPPGFDRQPPQPEGMSPGSFPVSQAPSQRSPLENMSMLGTGEQQVPDFRTQIRDVLDPTFREMSFEFAREMNEALADQANAMERRHLI